MEPSCQSLSSSVVLFIAYILCLFSCHEALNTMCVRPYALGLNLRPEACLISGLFDLPIGIVLSYLSVAAVADIQLGNELVRNKCR